MPALSTTTATVIPYAAVLAVMGAAGANATETALGVQLPPGVAIMLLGAAGGCARYLQGYLSSRNFSIGDILASAAISAFAASMCVLACVTARLIDEQTIFLVAGVGGWMGTRALEVLEDIIKRVSNKGP